MRIRLAENFRAVFYAPFYATLACGEFARQGLEVDLIDSATPGSGTAALESGSIDVTWGGPMRAMKAWDGAGAPLVCFAEVVRRDPFYLVGRPSAAPLRLTDLAHLTLGSVSEVPTPWLCLQHDLRKAGIDPAAVRRIADRPMAQNLAAVARGDLDLAQVFEPYATLAVEKGLEIRHAAADRGPTSYTTFLTTPANLARHRRAFAAMTRAVAGMQRWLASASGAEIAAAVAAYFPHLSPAVLAAAFDRYKERRVWAEDPAVSRQGFDRLAESLRSGGFIRRSPDYEACVVDPLALDAQ
jgi:NitT/TauT family transport system substrate-binding protein